MTRCISFSAQVALMLALLIAPRLAGAATVTVSVGAAQAVSGGDVDVPISVAGASGLSSMQMALTYAPALLEVKDVVAGPLLPENALLAHDAKEPGRLGVGFVALEGLKGDGTVFKVRFATTGKPGEKSALALENVRAWEKTDLEMLVHAVPGELAIPPARWPWWLWVAGVAALMLLMLAIRRAKRRPASAAGPPLEAGGLALCRNPACRKPLPSGVRFCPNCGQEARHA